MRRRPRFRPYLDGCKLEDRVVLSLTAMVGSATAGAASSPLRAPAPGSILRVIRDRTVAQFDRAFTDFAQAFGGAATSILFASTSNGAPQIAANRAAFDAQVQQAIIALTSNLNATLALSPLAKYDLTPNINNDLAGPSNSLQSQLQALASPSATNAQSFQDFGANASAAILKAHQTVINRLNDFFSPDNPLRQHATGGGGSALDAIHRSYVKNVIKAFQALENGYAGVASGTLLAGQNVSQLAAQRAKFDAQVTAGVYSVAANITAQLQLFPSAQSQLVPSIQDRLVNGSNSLLSQAQSLPTPTDFSGVSVQSFAAGAASAIRSARRDVLAMVNEFFNNPVPPRQQIAGGSGTGGGQTSSGTGTTGNGTTGTGSTGNGSGLGTGNTGSGSNQGAGTTGSNNGAGNSLGNSGTPSAFNSGFNTGFTNGFTGTPLAPTFVAPANGFNYNGFNGFGNFIPTSTGGATTLAPGLGNGFGTGPYNGGLFTGFGSFNGPYNPSFGTAFGNGFGGAQGSNLNNNLGGIYSGSGNGQSF